ncbi:MAG: NAD(P)-dependent dehydrogenase (short-subunit alcohol dehydrogenase family) [Halieaceae bacterium]|jgi:NAD(P)-dependent dehydrogenase (short-subunit alcohol dehydrogenase family)
MNKLASYPSLAGKAVFISGGATGIGAALVEAFHRQNAKVGFVDLDSKAAEGLQRDLLTKTGNEPWFCNVDVSDVPALREAIDAATKVLGPISILINNVANDDRHSPESVTEEFWQQSMAVNLDATFFACQRVFEGMKTEGGGSIINFSSINALLGPSNMPGYVTAKAGLIGMTKALARDYGDAGVRVNAILPGWVVTERQLDTWLTPEAESAWMEQVALKTRLLPQDVANLALFLAAGDSSMITGQSLTIDGGRT